MADNYLEKKYEELQSRKAGLGKKKTTGLHKTRRVFVTDGIKGIGPAIVKAFRLAGNRVAFCGTDEEAGKLFAEKTGTTFHHADAADKEAFTNCLQNVLQNWGDLDIIIHNATFCPSLAPITETGVEDFEQMFSTGLRPMFIASRLLALHRQTQTEANPYGRIITTACPSAEVQALTSSLAASLAEWRITVNSITGGLTESNGEDVIRMCLFLCQEENKSLNGQNITIDGGLSKGIY